MTISDELKTTLKQVREEVNSWEPWKRSRDPLGSENQNGLDCKSRNDSPSVCNQQESKPFSS